MYPLEGYSPLESPPSRDLLKAQILFNYLDRLLPTLVEEPEVRTISLYSNDDDENNNSNNTGFHNTTSPDGKIVKMPGCMTVIAN